MNKEKVQQMVLDDMNNEIKMYVDLSHNVRELIDALELARDGLVATFTAETYRKSIRKKIKDIMTADRSQTNKEVVDFIKTTVSESEETMNFADLLKTVIRDKGDEKSE